MGPKSPALAGFWALPEGGLSARCEHLTVLAGGRVGRGCPPFQVPRGLRASLRRQPYRCTIVTGAGGPAVVKVISHRCLHMWEVSRARLLIGRLGKDVGLGSVSVYGILEKT